MTPPRIDLRIDELVLEGLEGVDAARLSAAVRRELARLMAGDGVPATWRRGGGPRRLDGGEIRVEPGMGDEALGARVARAVFDAGDPGGSS